MIERNFFDPLYELRNKPVDEASSLQDEQLRYEYKQNKQRFAASITSELRKLLNKSDLEQKPFLQAFLEKLNSEQYVGEIMRSIEESTPDGLSLVRNDAMNQTKYVAEIIIASVIDQIDYIIQEDIGLDTDDYKKATLGGYPASEYARHVANSELKDKLSYLTPAEFKASTNILRAQRIVFESFKNL